MKKTYLYLTALLSFVLAAFTPAHADETVTFHVGQSTGFWTDWNNNPNNQWAKKWESTQEDPHIIIVHASNANNLNYHDGSNISFYKHL